jgi:hypothetical protein
MQDVIVHPGSIEDALGAGPAAAVVAPERVGEVVLPSRTLTAAERIGVYHGMYLMRMEEALAFDYPVIKHHVGAHDFWHLVREYVQEHPSRSFTLARLGDHLPRFIAEHAWGGASSRFLGDLARMELAMTEAFDAPRGPVLSLESVAQVPADAWRGARLRPVSSFRLVEMSHDGVRHLEAYKEQRPSPQPRRRASFVAFYRPDVIVLRRELSRAQHDLLRDLAAGVQLGPAVESAASRLRERDRIASVQDWFRSWVSDGMFGEVVTA